MCVVLTQLKIIKIAQLKINNLRVIVVCAGLHVYNRLLHGFDQKKPQLLTDGLMIRFCFENAIVKILIA